MRTALAALGLLALMTTPLAKEPAGRGFEGALDRELASIVADRERPLASLAVLAIRDGKVVYQRGFGRRFIDPANAANDLPADERTLYRIASVTKLVTALAVMRLVEEGKLALDEDVSRYLGYRLRNPNFTESAITLRMLLTHRASLRDDAGYFWPEGTNIRDVLLSGGSLHGNGAMWSATRAPGDYFAYCNLNYGVVGTILEKVTGERFDRLMRRLVLDPLDMRGGFNPAEMPPERVRQIATLYRKARGDDERERWDPSGPWVAQVDDYSREAPVNRAGPGYAVGANGALFGPQGNLRASAADLGRVMLMLMNGGTLDGRRFLTRESVQALLARAWTHDGTNGESTYGTRRKRFNAWGLGNQHFVDVSGPGFGDRLVEGGGFIAIGHLGDAYGLNATFAFDPRARDGMIVLCGGTGFDPQTDAGAYSSLNGYEERILTALYQHAIKGARAPSR